MDKSNFLMRYNMRELKEYCKENNVIGISKLKKSDLINIMVDLQEFDYLYETMADETELEMIVEEPVAEPVAELGDKSWNCPCDEICGECAEEPIILHLPIKRLNLESVVINKMLKPKNYDKAYTKGKLILEKFKC
tara:strand:+ start:13 stop:420 length:408 start_codon:yes stop_codon:yes gene_type:complete